MGQLFKAIKKRPGFDQHQVDEEAVLLRAYGSGTQVLIDRDRTYSLGHLDANCIRDFADKTQARLSLTLCSQRTPWHLLCSRGLRTVCCTNSSKESHAVQMTCRGQMSGPVLLGYLDSGMLSFRLKAPQQTARTTTRGKYTRASVVN